MIGITYENQYGKQFAEDVLFNTLRDTKEFLVSKGFKEEARIFIKKTDWGNTTRAYIKYFKTP